MGSYYPITSPEMMADRLRTFGLSTIGLSRIALRSPVTRAMANQLIRCGPSVGANYEEAQAGESKADFTHKLQIALKEAREACYWLDLLSQIPSRVQPEAHILLREAVQLRAILSQAVISAKNRPSPI